MVNPFDESHKELIIKGIESSKFDVQINSEGNNIVVTLGAIPGDMKNESVQQCKKYYNSAKEHLKELRHDATNEIKKLEKILGKDESKRVDKELMDMFEK